MKYADRTALVAHVTNTRALEQYQKEVQTLVQTFTESLLELNVLQSKEVCCGSSGKNPELFQPLKIQGLAVEQVEALKYLGTEADTRLSFGQQTDARCPPEGTAASPPAEKTPFF